MSERALLRQNELQKLEAKAAQSRAPGMVIAKTHHFTGQIMALGDLAEHFAELERGDDDEEESPERETFKCFFRAVFRKWNSSNGPPLISSFPPKKTKEETGIIVETWTQSIPGPSNIPHHQWVTPAARQPGANAWLSVSTDVLKAVVLEFHDDNGRKAPEEFVQFFPGADSDAAKVCCVKNYDQVETDRAENFNRRLIISLARNRIVGFSEMGSNGSALDAPFIAADHQLKGRLVKPKLAGKQALEEMREKHRILTALYGDQYMDML